MKLNLKARSWHTWASIILALPILIVSATAVFIAHKKSLQTEDITLDVGWLPGYQTKGYKTKEAEPRAALTTVNGTTWVGTQEGLYRLDGSTLVAAKALSGMPVRGLAESRFGLVAAAKNGVWLEHSGEWTRVIKGDAWHASTRTDGSVVVSMKDKGLLVSANGQDWHPDPVLATALAALPEETNDKSITLGKLIMDLHTGQAFFGKQGEWIWIDIIGIAMCLLAMTGVFMWWRAEKRKTQIAGN